MPNCMAEDGQAAVFVGTFLTNGESVALCDEHMVYFCASTLQDMTGVDPAPFIAAISDEEPGIPPEMPPEDPDGLAGVPAVITPDPTPRTPKSWPFAGRVVRSTHGRRRRVRHDDR